MTPPPTSFTLRDALPSDLVAYTTLINTESLEPNTPEAVAERERSTRQVVHFYHRWVLEDAEGHLLGTALLFNDPLNSQEFNVNVLVSPGARARRFGSALLGRAHDTARAQGARTLVVSVRDVNPKGRTWAERRGYSLRYHRFESALDLTTFNESAHAEVVQRVAEAGITIQDMQTLGVDEANWPRLYDFSADRTEEAPDMQGMPRMPAEQSQRLLRQSPNVRPEWIVLATRGEEWLGLSVMTSHPHGVHNAFTAVAPEARGIGLARALKVEVIRRARAPGMSRMTTNNLSVNAPMLAVNRRLGFEARPGWWVMHRPMA